MQDINAQIYSASGTPLGGVIAIEGGADNANEPDVIGLKDGGFYIVYDNDTDDHLEGRRFDSAGNQIGTTHIVSSTGGGLITRPELGLTSDGRILVTFSDATDIRSTILDPRDTTIYLDSTEVVATTRRLNDTTVYGSADGETILGQSGDDTIHGNGGDDTVKGGSGNDTITGSNGNDNLDGESGNDVIEGGSGIDTISGGDGDDAIDGGDDNDVLNGGSGNDVLEGGAGIDLLDMSAATAGFTLNFNGKTVTAVGLGTDTFFDVEGAHRVCLQ